MTTKHKEALSIALYDSNILICKDGYDNPFHLCEFEKIKISGSDLKDIAKCFDIDINERKIPNTDFELFYKEVDIYLVNAKAKINKIDAKIENGILDVFIFIKWDDLEKITSEHFSYSGKFSVFWK